MISGIKRLDLLRFARSNVMFVFMLVAFLVMWISIPSFGNMANIISLFNQICIYGVAALGMTFLIIAGEFDMSMGSVLSFTTIIVAFFCRFLNNAALGVICGLSAGALFGFVNGFLAVKGKINVFIVTLSTMVIIKGMSITFCDILGMPSAIQINNDVLYEFGNGKIFGVPYLVLLFLILVVISTYILKNTFFGRRLYAIGGNVDVSMLSGINVGRNKIYAFVVAGFSAGIAGVMMVSKMQAGIPLYADDLPLTAVCAVVLGGSSLAGGRGNALNTLVGIIILSLMTNAFNQLGVDPYVQNTIKGLVVVAVVVVDGLIKVRKSRSR